MKEIYFSIIVATYNSENTIDLALSSIRNQQFEQDMIEIILVDGGSTDHTLEIAEKYHVRVIQNPYRLPEPAKLLGVKAAIGKYFIIMDSDESLNGGDILSKRKALLEQYPHVKCLFIGYTSPENVNSCCHYYNAVGDPFSCFVYGIFKNSMAGLIKRHKGIHEEGIHIVSFGKKEIRPIGDSAIVMERKYVLEHYMSENDELEFTTVLFDRMMVDTGYVGHIEGDMNIHNTSSDFTTYFKKLKFRIVNNVHDINRSGYSNRAQYSKLMSRRKYLYVLYAASIVLPIIDGIRMSFHYKHPIFLLHPVFTEYVFIEIGIQMLKKLIGIKEEVNTYAK